ncbi:hypothetical protein VTO42DRAFT_8759 [Malbranchea cinnamomea]
MWISGMACFAVPILPDASRYEVKSLPASPPLARSWAGQLPILGQEDGSALFFWLFEAEDKANDDTLIIWLNGGPGCSSLIRAFSENGPLMFLGNSSTLVPNPYSWTRLANVLYVDQPVGTGFSHTTLSHEATTNKQVVSDFFAWLQGFYRLFPGMLNKRTHMLGEAYAGAFVPYFASEIVKRHRELPVNLVSTSIGNGVFGNNAAMSATVTTSYLREQASTLGIPADIFEAFSAADDACGFASVIRKGSEYPPQEPISLSGNPENLNFKRQVRSTAVLRRDTNNPIEEEEELCNIIPTSPESVMESILNSPCYGPCATFSTAADYLETMGLEKCFNIYNIKYNCSSIDPISLLAAYLNRQDVQHALNIRPTAVPFTPCNRTILSTLLSPSNHIVPPAYSVLPSLLSDHGISVHIYHGELDMLIPDQGVELAIQNMTWN